MVQPVHIIPVEDDTPELGGTRARIRSLIRAGHLVDGPRSCGKTQALVELLHELVYEGKEILIIVPTHREVGWFESRFRYLYPGTKPPRVRVGDPSLLSRGARTPNSVYVDGFFRCDPGFMDACWQHPSIVVKGIA